MELTAMKQLMFELSNYCEDMLSEAKKLRNNNEDTSSIDATYVAFSIALKLTKNKIELEKQQIIDACAFGRYVNQDDRTEGEQYYNRKYGTNQTDTKVD